MADKLHSVDYATILDALCEGEIDGVVGGLAGVYLNNIPVLKADGSKNLEGVEGGFRVGTATQKHFRNIPSASKVLAVNSPIINRGFTDSSGFTHPATPAIVNVNQRADAIVIALKWPGGLSSLNTNKGTWHDRTTTFTLEYRCSCTGNAWTGLGTVTSSSKIPWTVQPKSLSLPGSHILYPPPAIKTYGCSLLFNVMLVNMNDGSFGEGDTLPRYFPTGIRISIDYRVSGTTDWTSFASNRYISPSDMRFVGMFYPYVYFYIDVNIPTFESYEYNITFHSSDRPIVNLSFGSKHYFAPTTTSGAIKVEGLSKTEFKKYWYFSVPEAHRECHPFDFRVSRHYVDDDEENPKHSARTYTSSYLLSTLEVIIEETLNYPYTALAGLEFDASSYNNLPSRSYDTKLLKIHIPDNYDPLSRTYTGLWTGNFKVAWSDNPAWAFYDLVTKNRYGMGQYIDASMIDKWILYEIAKFCDVLVDSGYGYKEPRYTINTYIARQEEALVLIRNLASIFRGIIYWLDNKITCAYDHPSDPIASFSNTNVIDGLFTYSGSSKNTRYNVVNVAWNDPLRDYKVAIEVVEDDRVIINEVNSYDLTALGCTSRGQARRQGKAFLATERQTVNFAHGLDNVGIKPGDLANIYDRYKANIRFSGRKVNIDDTNPNGKIYLDAGITLTAGVSYTLGVVSIIPKTRTLPDGEIENINLPEILYFTFTDADYNNTEASISVNTQHNSKYLLQYYLSKEIAPNSVWTVSETNIQPQLYRVISLKDNGDNTFVLDCLEFNQTKQAWIDENKGMDIPNEGVEGGSLYEIDNVVVKEGIVNLGNTKANVISINWGIEPNSGIKEFRVEYKYSATVEGGGNWVYFRTVNDSSFTQFAPGADAGWYTARVSVVLSAGGSLSPVESISAYMTGESAPPLDILQCPNENPCLLGFTYTALNSGVLRLSWPDSTDYDFKNYEVQNGTIWDNSSNKVYANITNNYLDIIGDFTNTFMIKAVDYSGIYSLVGARLQIPMGLPAVSNIKGLFTTSGYKLSWNITQGLFDNDYVKVESNNGAGGRLLVANVSNSPYETVDLRYWSDSIAAVYHTYYLTPYDKSGSSGATVSFQTYLPKTEVRNLLVVAPYDSAFVNISSDWYTEAFPISYTEFYVDGALKHDEHTDNFGYTLPSSGTFKIGLIPVDIAGRKGTLSEFTLTVSAAKKTIMNSILRKDATVPAGIFLDSGHLIGPVDKTQTWAEHFSIPGYATIDAQIADGHPNYMIPTTTATYSEIYQLDDYPTNFTKTAHVFVECEIDTLVFTRVDGGAWVSAPLIETGTINKYDVVGDFDEVKVDYVFTPTAGIPAVLETAKITATGDV